MRLYEGTTQTFITDTLMNTIATKLEQSFENYYKRRANPAEVRAWQNSLNFLKNILEHSQLITNHIILEYELPYSTRRIDCILFGKDFENNANVVVIELKQWTNVEDDETEDNVVTFIAGTKRSEAHPACQVRAYHFFLKDFIPLFEEEKTYLFSCAYCHNYSPQGENVLFKEKFRELLKEFPLFTKNDFENFGTYLKKRLEKGEGLEIFNRFITSPIRPSKKLLEHTHQMIHKNEQIFHLIDEQLVANNTIIDRAKKAAHSNKKCVIIVRGGPGTGKSVIALNALATLLSENKTVYHATGSAAFTTILRKILGNRVSHLFKYFNSFTRAKENEIDILICDEAHRIRKTSASRYTRKEDRSDIPQIDELIRAAKLSVFFIDDNQVVRPTEIGSSELIRLTAQKYNAQLEEFELTTQFRCSGSDNYLDWLDNLFQIRKTTHEQLSAKDKMGFKIFDSPQELYEVIQRRNLQKSNSARMVAGFCWPWSNTKPDGTLVEDVVIGDFKMTWEAKNDSPRLAPGVVKANLWAHDPQGVTQMGSVYTIQGFEFDYVGVVFGNDLIYDPSKGTWVGIKANSADPNIKRAKADEFTKYLKNVYRVLLTRGMKGCYVYFLDKYTENYVRSKLGI